MKEKFIKFYIAVAEATSKLSYAKKLKVGCVIVKGDQIIGTGYNGTPSNWDNVCEYEALPGEEPKTKPEVLHSEMNALMKVCMSHESSKNAILFCTHSPCMDCAKAIYQAGIQAVIYKNKYRNDAGIDFLSRCGVDVRQYKPTS